VFRSCANLCTPPHTAAKTVTGIKLWRLLFIFSAGFRLSHETFSQRILVALLKLETPLDFLSPLDYCCRFFLYGHFFWLYVLAIFCAGLENNKNITRDIPENWSKKTNFLVLVRKVWIIIAMLQKQFRIAKLVFRI